MHRVLECRRHERTSAAGAVVISGGGIIVIIVIVTVTAPEQPEQFLVTPGLKQCNPARRNIV